MKRICLIGAGNIAQAHAEALAALPGLRVTAIVDSNLASAKRLAERWNVGQVFASAREALAADAFDRAHVLVPPDLHAEITLPLLQAGRDVLVEKPLATDATSCDSLIAAAAASGAKLGVNQNFVHHPAFARLRRVLDRNLVGRPNFVSCIYNVPLRQMMSRQFGHWMFCTPGNILLEQAVHPLSQIAALAGPIGVLSPLAGPAVEIVPGLPFYPTLNLSLACTQLPAQLRFAVGQAFPFWQVTAVCEDGVVVADILANRLAVHGRTRWLEAVDGMVSGGRMAGAMLRDSVRNMSDYALAMARLKRRSDPFFLSMLASIAAFHRSADAGTDPELDGRFGANLVGACEDVTAQAFARPAAPAARAKSDAVSGDGQAPEVAILGGTGFIGTHVVRRFREAGYRVSVLARSTRNLPAIFADPLVTLHAGDIRDRDAVLRVIGSARVVVNLAHGGGGVSREAVRQAMVGGAETVARACLEKQVKRLIHVGSIAALYLGPQGQAITGATPPDERPDDRADYARAKVLCDRMLLDLHAREGLPVCILRPGVVIGEGGSPFHSGLGFYNNDQHCIGWNRGRNRLPLVLVEDVADAILRAADAAGIEGKCYNLVGDVQLSAREYTEALGLVLKRPLRFHPQTARLLWSRECGKWLVKRATGKKVPPPTMRDLLSRGMEARFDCTDAKRDLGWRPVSDSERFQQRALRVHAL